MKRRLLEWCREIQSEVSWPRITVVEARENFGNPEEGERSPLEAFTRRLINIVD
jgi:hypothetical protein